MSLKNTLASLIVLSSLLLFGAEVQGGQSGVYKITVDEKNCRRPQRALSLNAGSMESYIQYYTRKIITQNLLTEQVICDLGAGRFYQPVGVKDRKGLLHLDVAQAEIVIQYGDYLTKNPSDEVSVFFIFREDGVVRAMLVADPQVGSVWSVSKEKNPLSYSIGKGSYTATSLKKNSASVTNTHYTLSN